MDLTNVWPAVLCPLSVLLAHMSDWMRPLNLQKADEVHGLRPQQLLGANCEMSAVLCNVRRAAPQHLQHKQTRLGCARKSTHTHTHTHIYRPVERRI